uniref:Uncharacterized protein n=1 Tax=Myotis myotis TaxID=51298 RepID=A0A7J7Z656_MYOMY|nr:hypothetical protein mMyoMyo1_010764 [Myotis myotis]
MGSWAIPVLFPSLTLICPSVKWVYGEQGLLGKHCWCPGSVWGLGEWWLRLLALGLQPPTAPVVLTCRRVRVPMSSILPLPWREDDRVPSLTEVGRLEGSPHLWKRELREAGMLHGSVLAFGISKAPLNPGPWALEPGVLGEGSAQSRKCWLGPEREAGPLQPS